MPRSGACGRFRVGARGRRSPLCPYGRFRRLPRRLAGTPDEAVEACRSTTRSLDGAPFSRKTGADGVCAFSERRFPATPRRRAAAPRFVARASIVPLRPARRSSSSPSVAVGEKDRGVLEFFGRLPAFADETADLKPEFRPWFRGTVSRRFPLKFSKDFEKNFLRESLPPWRESLRHIRRCCRTRPAALSFPLACWGVAKR